MSIYPLGFYLGYYQIDKLVVQTQEVDLGLAVAFPGVPEGYEVFLEIEGPPPASGSGRPAWHRTEPESTL